MIIVLEPHLKRNTFSKRWQYYQILPNLMWEFENRQACTVINSSREWHQASIFEKKEMISFSPLSWHRCGFCLWQVQGNGSWNLDMRCSSLLRVHSSKSRIRHAKIIPTLSLWSNGLDLLRQHVFIHTTSSTERHTAMKGVLLLWSRLLKNASNSPSAWGMWNVMRPGVTWPKSINFQLSHASSVIHNSF